MIWPRTGGLLHRNRGTIREISKGKWFFFLITPISVTGQAVNKIKKKPNSKLVIFFLIDTDMCREKSNVIRNVDLSNSDKCANTEDLVTD